MDKKLFFLGAIALVALTLNGCMPRVVRVINVTSDHVRDLEMQNAALKAANEYLQNGR